MRRAVLLIAAVVVLVAAGVAYGLRTDRWGPSANLTAAADRVAGLPDKFGDWEGAPLELDPRQVEEAHVTGITARKYTHKYTRAETVVLVITGRPGPVSVHTPDVCYSTAGFVPGPNEVRPLPGGGKAWTAEFTKPGPPPESLRIYWTWSTGGEWLAPTAQRTAFARAPVLHKLYVIRPVAARAEPGEDADEVEFMTQLLADLRARVARPA